MTKISELTRFAVLGLALMSMPHPAAAQADDILSRDNVLRDPDIPAYGNPKGDITIVEYFDYQCPYCRKVDPVLARVAREDGKVRVVFKDWPIFGGASVYAAKMVLAAKYQNKYRQAHEALMHGKARLTEDDVRNQLQAAGVDVALLERHAESNRDQINAILARNELQARAFEFRGTPAFIVGTFKVPGVLDETGFKQAIAAARKAAAGQ